jgi:iron(III) transport system ATP-binding protein
MKVSVQAADVRFAGVAKRYGTVTAVKPLDLTVEAGSLVTLLGPSGCGKTTLLRIIAGLEHVSAGRVFIGNRDVTNLSAAERNAAMVFQSYALFPHLNVEGNVAFGLISGGLSRREARDRSATALATVGLAGLGDRLPSELSGGQQQRVALARALVLEPEVLLLDEPLSNLDARLRRTMRDEIRALQRRLEITVVYVTHDQSEALAVSDKIVVMKAAEVVQVGTPRELYLEPANLFVATFIGEASHLKGTIESIEHGHAVLSLGNAELRIPHHGAATGPVDVVVRPEAVRMESADIANTLAGIIQTATYMGSHVEYTVDTPAGSIFAIVPGAKSICRPGSNVGLLLADQGVIIVRP